MSLGKKPSDSALQEGRVATLQSLSGTGSLRVAAEFIGKFLPGTTAYLSNPTWGNHKVSKPSSNFRLHLCLFLAQRRPFIPVTLAFELLCAEAFAATLYAFTAGRNQW